jgi:ubiquinone/menaquinone biosynthesis C-methylase UbiE
VDLQYIDVTQTDPRLSATRQAFDSVAETYDGPRGNNALIQRMREQTWKLISHYVAPGGRLLDIGCGTGIDAEHFARAGYSVVASDWSPEMVARTAARSQAGGLGERLQAARVGAHELHCLDGRFDGAYSNFGPLNCVDDLGAVSRECGRLLTPGGHMIFTVIGRVCPWEFLYYLTRMRLRRACVRFARQMTAVNLNKHTVWTRYYTPAEFYRSFSPQFELIDYRAFSLFVPPPYLLPIYQRSGALGRGLAWLDDRVGGWPVLRNAGDHFLIVLRKRQR